MPGQGNIDSATHNNAYRHLSMTWPIGSGTIDWTGTVFNPAAGFNSEVELILEEGASYSSGVVTVSTIGTWAYRGVGFNKLLRLGGLWDEDDDEPPLDTF